MSCGNRGSTRWYYSGNQVGFLNHTGEFNSVAGGPPGSGISAGVLVSQFFPGDTSRNIWEDSSATLTQELLDAAFPYIELNWICDIRFNDDVVFRVSDRNLYVEDENGLPRFYQARCYNAPQIQVSLGEWLNPQYVTGDLTLTLNNRDGFFNQYLPQGSSFEQWIGSHVSIKVGFGQELTNYYEVFNGAIATKQGVSTTEDDLILKIFDAFDRDDVPVPMQVFNINNFPGVQEEAEGKGVPIIYGDWTVDVGLYGEVPAYCINIGDGSNRFKVSETPLSELTQVWLHRGTNNAESPDGPLAMSFSADLDRGEFTISGYSYIKGDKVTVKCKGKTINALYKNRISDAGLLTANPVSLTVDLTGHYWFADNLTQKIYQISFKDEIKREITYSQISGSLSNVSGISWAFDNTLWIYDKNLSTIFRFILADNATGLSFHTNQVSGIGAALADGRGLTIDSGNILYLCNNTTGVIYKINPFAPSQPTVTGTISVTSFDPSAIDIQDLSVDVNLNHLLVVDRATNKFYRVNPSSGALISQLALTTVNGNIAHAVGVSSPNDGTIFVLSRSDNTVYNYNEASDAFTNPGWQVRDLLHVAMKRTPGDFDPRWGQVCREDLATYHGRLWIGDRTTVVPVITQYLGEYNTSVFHHFGKLVLYHMTFDRFSANGLMIREGDIKENSFNPSKEYNQYFNALSVNYRKMPFSGKVTTSDTYVSKSSVEFLGRQIPKTLDWPNAYRRLDVDRLAPLFVRLAAPEPEFVNVTLGWRFLFAQLNSFYRINFDALIDPITGERKGGRRFNSVPAFVRQIRYNLDDMTLQLKLWSLGTTQFPGWIPAGTILGGSEDEVVLTTLGTQGYIAPIGDIVNAGAQSVLLSYNAETRSAAIAGNAWLPGFVAAIRSGVNHSVRAVVTISNVDGQTITFTEPHGVVLNPTERNNAGLITGGDYLTYAPYEHCSAAQKEFWAFFGFPDVGYPASGAEEQEDQRAGFHNFPDGRVPYLLHPIDFIPT